MRKRIMDQLWVGDLRDCKAVHEGWSVVHAARNPCYVNKCGEPPKGAPVSLRTHLSHRDGAHLYLNIIDPSAPLFQRKVFEDFITFARGEWQTGRPLLIHCNKGESRAPSLALIFLAKVLYKITDASYDEAWQEFEELIGQAYTPSSGIEQWLREHWKDLDGGKKLPSMQGAAEESTILEAPIGPMKKPETAEEIAVMIRSLPLYHFSGCCEIENKLHVWARPQPNSLQFDVTEAYDWAMANGLACRLIVLKPRQVGCSTICGHLCYHHMRRFQCDMLVMADVAKRTRKVYQILNDYSQHDFFPWGSTYEFNTERGRFTYADGSTGAVEHDTAQDPKAGISGTRQVIWFSEPGRYPKTNGRDRKVVTAALGSLADSAQTLGIMESTAEGSAGVYFDTYQGAVTLAQRKRGIIGNGWVKIFASWFEFAENCLQRTVDNQDYFADDLNDDERRGVKIYKWTPGQIAWRRKTLKEKCNNDIRMLNQDYPESEESAFLASGRAAFDMNRLAEMEAIATLNYPNAEKGELMRNDNGDLVFIPTTDGSGWLWVDERPTPGHAYIGFGDPCMGEQSEGSLYPDAHAFGILRDALVDQGNVVKKKLVAAIDVETGCRWPDPLLAERMKMVLDWYGECMITPETGNGLGVLSCLQKEGATIYQREKQGQMYPGQKLRVAGWETNKDTRPLVVNELGRCIREGSFECNFLPAIMEWKTFLINDRGRAEAKNNSHDDWVFGPGIGLVTISYAQRMNPPRVFSQPETGAALQMPGGMPTSAFT